MNVLDQHRRWWLCCIDATFKPCLLFLGSLTCLVNALFLNMYQPLELKLVYCYIAEFKMNRKYPLKHVKKSLVFYILNICFQKAFGSIACLCFIIYFYPPNPHPPPPTKLGAKGYGVTSICLSICPHFRFQSISETHGGITFILHTHTHTHITLRGCRCAFLWVMTFDLLFYLHLVAKIDLPPT